MQLLRTILIGLALISGITLTVASSAQGTVNSAAQAKSCCSSECHSARKDGKAHGDHHEAGTAECSTDGPDCCKHGNKTEHKAGAHANSAGVEGHSCCGDGCCKDGCCSDGTECATMQHGTSAAQHGENGSSCAECPCCKDQSCCTSTKKVEKG